MASSRVERKRATVMFADLVGYTALSDRVGGERAYLITTECLKRLDAIVRKHGGAVDRYLGDCLMAVFGHPIPLDDDAGAAAEAALEMRDLVGSYSRQLGLEVPLELKLGLNTGSLVAGDIRAGGAIREFHVLGDTVNVSARLKAKAPANSIYVGEGTRDDTLGRYDFGELGGLQLKGKTERVATFELRGRRGTRIEVEEPVATAFVGREAELELLRGVLAARRSAAFAVTGEDGIGKSRLLAELRRSTPGIEWHTVAPQELAGLDPAELCARAPLVLEVDEVERAEAADLESLHVLIESTAAAPVVVLLAGRPGPETDAVLEQERVRSVRSSVRRSTRRSSASRPRGSGRPTPSVAARPSCSRT
jgi:class 3 adenylate cyclase